MPRDDIDRPTGRPADPTDDPTDDQADDPMDDPAVNTPANPALNPPIDPAVDQAAATLGDLRAIGLRSRWAASRGLSRVPLMAWGLAWAIGYPVLDRAAWPTAVVVGLVLAVGALVATWLFRPQQVRTGWEGRGRASWAVLMLSSPLLVAVITPLPGRRVALFLGALWGVALVLLAVATADRALGGVGGLIVIVAAGCRILQVDHALTPFGLLSGVAMMALGGWRIWRSR